MVRSSASSSWNALCLCSMAKLHVGSLSSRGSRLRIRHRPTDARGLLRRSADCRCGIPVHPGHPPLDRVAHGARPAPGCATAGLVLPQERHQRVASAVAGTATPASSAKVGQRSMFSTRLSRVRPWATPGPVTTSGTWMSVSKAVIFPASGGVHPCDSRCRS